MNYRVNSGWMSIDPIIVLATGHYVRTTLNTDTLYVGICDPTKQAGHTEVGRIHIMTADPDTQNAVAAAFVENLAPTLKKIEGPIQFFPGTKKKTDAK